MTAQDPSRFHEGNTRGAVALALLVAQEDRFVIHGDGRLSRIHLEPQLHARLIMDMPLPLPSAVVVPSASATANP